MPTIYNIRDFGALGDGHTNDATAIQAAVNTCSAAGGGQVLVPAGAVYLSGSILLKSNVELHVERGATLQCTGTWSAITQRWKLAIGSPYVGESQPGYAGSFITARGAENIAITGAGTIDGGGRHYVLNDQGPIYEMSNDRPFTLFFYRCSRVDLRETYFRDGAAWMLRLTGCTDVVMRGLRVEGDMKLPLADGIDLDHCRNVRISDCYVSTPDDAISFKTCAEFPDLGPTENITITNCVLQSNSSAVAIGVEANNPIRNIVVSNCVVRYSNRGLSVTMAHQALYENILFSNIVVETRMHDERWHGKGEPLYVSAFPFVNDNCNIRNVRFVNIVARSASGVFVDAIRPGLIHGLVFDNVHIELECGSGYASGQFDRRAYPDEPLPGYPTAGFFVKNAADVTLRDCVVVNRNGVKIPELVTHAVEGLKLGKSMQSATLSE